MLRPVSERKRHEIRRTYRLLRAALDLTQAEVEDRARQIYPEFRKKSFPRIETGLDFPSPTERKALAKVLKVNEAELPTPDGSDVAERV